MNMERCYNKTKPKKKKHKLGYWRNQKGVLHIFVEAMNRRSPHAPFSFQSNVICIIYYNKVYVYIYL